MSGDEHDVRVIALRDPALEIQSVDVRELHVQDQASRDVGLRIRHVFGSGTERDRVHVEARKKLDNASRIRRSSSTMKTMWSCAIATMVHPALSRRIHPSVSVAQSDAKP